MGFINDVENEKKNESEEPLHHDKIDYASDSETESEKLDSANNNNWFGSRGRY